jgi:hypothetical protein
VIPQYNLETYKTITGEEEKNNIGVRDKRKMKMKRGRRKRENKMKRRVSKSGSERGGGRKRGWEEGEMEMDKE